jgi:hypothetical protein
LTSRGSRTPRAERLLGSSNVETAKVKLLTEPRGAEVFRRGDAQGSLGKTPLELRLSNIGEEVEFVFRLAGYQDAAEKIIVADNTVVSVALERREGAAIKVTPIGPRPRTRRPTTRPTNNDDSLFDSYGKKSTTVDPPPTVKTKTKGPTKINPDDVRDPFAR